MREITTSELRSLIEEEILNSEKDGSSKNVMNEAWMLALAPIAGYMVAGAAGGYAGGLLTDLPDIEKELVDQSGDISEIQTGIASEAGRMITVMAAQLVAGRAGDIRSDDQLSSVFESKGLTADLLNRIIKEEHEKVVSDIASGKIDISNKQVLNEGFPLGYAAMVALTGLSSAGFAMIGDEGLERRASNAVSQNEAFIKDYQNLLKEMKDLNDRIKSHIGSAAYDQFVKPAPPLYTVDTTVSESLKKSPKDVGISELTQMIKEEWSKKQLNEVGVGGLVPPDVLKTISGLIAPKGAATLRITQLDPGASGTRGEWVDKNGRPLPGRGPITLPARAAPLIRTTNAIGRAALAAGETAAPATGAPRTPPTGTPPTTPPGTPPKVPSKLGVRLWGPGGFQGFMDRLRLNGMSSLKSSPTGMSAKLGTFFAGGGMGGSLGKIPGRAAGEPKLSLARYQIKANAGWLARAGGRALGPASLLVLPALLMGGSSDADAVFDAIREGQGLTRQQIDDVRKDIAKYRRAVGEIEKMPKGRFVAALKAVGVDG